MLTKLLDHDIFWEEHDINSYEKYYLNNHVNIAFIDSLVPSDRSQKFH